MSGLVVGFGEELQENASNTSQLIPATIVGGIVLCYSILLSLELIELRRGTLNSLFNKGEAFFYPFAEKAVKNPCYAFALFALFTIGSSILAKLIFSNMDIPDIPKTITSAAAGFGIFAAAAGGCIAIKECFVSLGTPSPSNLNAI